MADDIPPLSHDIVQFLTAISSPPHDNHLPLPHASSTDLQQSDRNNTDHHHQHNPNLRDASEDVTEQDEEFRRSHRRHALRLRLRDLGLSAGRHDRILDWAELLLQLEDQSVTFGLQRLEFEDGYDGDPDDYVDMTAYESLLQTLASDGGSGRRGAPAAAKAVVEALETVEVNESVNGCADLCAVCNDEVFDGEEKVVKRLPCGHLYHGECITPWLNSANTCPVCRYELATDDPEYEQGRMARGSMVGDGDGDGSGV